MRKLQTKEFLEKLFKNLDGNINLRIIDTHNKATNKFFKSIDDLLKYDMPKDKNIYVGMYSRKGRNGKAVGCLTTNVLWADFDNVKDIKKIKSIIKKSNLPEPSIYVNSGHGIHTYWLLDEKAENEAVVLVKAIAKITGADMRAAEKARVMRLPDTQNVKGEPVKCEVLESNNNVYTIKVFQELLAVGEEIAAGVEENIIQNAPNELLSSNRPCIRNAAAGVKEGHRNFMLGRITKYLQVRGYTKENTRKILIKWNSNNNPPENTEKLLYDFEAYWNEDYKLLGCSIDNPELQSILYDYCDRGQCTLGTGIGQLKLNNSLKYNNRLFNDIKDLTGNDLIILGVLTRHRAGLTTSKLTDKLTRRLTKECCVSRPTLLNSIETLRKRNLIQVIEGNRRAGKENLYKVIHQGTYGTGYTIVTNGAINGAIDGRVTPGEFKLYVLLLKYAFNKGNCYPSLEELGKELRTSRSNVSIYIRRLEEADYIQVQRGYLNIKDKLVMTLLV